jgi:ketosteroid isomerase-like protein
MTYVCLSLCDTIIVHTLLIYITHNITTFDMDIHHATSLINMYGTAWEKKDPSLLSHIFTEDATYADPKEPVSRGIDAITQYWSTKIVEGQSDIVFQLLHVWMDGDTVIAEWHATFEDTKRQIHIEMTEVAIFGVRGDRFSSIREYYTSRHSAIEK